MTKCVGMDVHSKQTTYAAQTEAVELVAIGKVETTREGFRQMLANTQRGNQHVKRTHLSG